MNTRLTLVAIVGTLLLGAACGQNQRSSVGPTSVDGSRSPGVTGLSVSVGSGGSSISETVDFPPRNEPFDFRNQLEAKYRDQLRRPARPTSVDLEGDIVWTQRYLRYRVNGCGHSDAVQKVFSQIDAAGIAPVCGTPPTGTIAFPPRNEPFDFRARLEAKYRDGLGRSPGQSSVDIEGDIVWTQEYLRYRVNNCAHADAVLKVFAQIDGLGIQPTCLAAEPPPPPPPPGPTPVTVTIPAGATGLGAGAFGPNPRTIPVGTAVTWVNRDSVAHTSTADGGAWNLGPIAPGGRASFTFRSKGTFRYHCELHPSMVGTMIVR